MASADADTSKTNDKDEGENPGKGYRTSKEIDASNKQDVERTRKEAAGEA